MAISDNQYTIKQALDAVLKSYRLDEKLARHTLIQAWPKIMGPAIAKYTTDVFINGKELVVRLNSPALRQELSYGKENIIKMLNAEAGAEVINSITFQ